jgi:cell division protein FtsW
MSAKAPATLRRTRPRAPVADAPPIDKALLWAALSLLGLGLVMMASASVAIADRAVGQPWYFLLRQSLFAGVGLFAAFVVLRTPLDLLQRHSGALLLLAIALLAVLMVPGVGKEVNGSTRWLTFGPLNVQPAEFAKLCMILYLSAYLVRRGEEVRNAVSGFAKPMLVVALLCALLLMQPDFGTAAVLAGTAACMMFLGGVRLRQFGILIAVVLGALATLAVSSPYRLARITAFVDPWADPFASGFQLTQALIAFGRGEWFGVGLGSSIQKLFYLPEAHTDFLFAVLAEELGLAGSLAVILVFAFIVAKAFMIGRRAERADRLFGAWLAYGIGVWIGLQSFINIGVNMGVLPTKGLTLPLMSYGGTSLVMSCIAIALLLRVDFETRQTLFRRLGRPEEDAW